MSLIGYTNPDGNSRYINSTVYLGGDIVVDGFTDNTTVVGIGTNIQPGNLGKNGKTSSTIIDGCSLIGPGGITVQNNKKYDFEESGDYKDIPFAIIGIGCISKNSTIRNCVYDAGGLYWELNGLTTITSSASVSSDSDKMKVTFVAIGIGNVFRTTDNKITNCTCTTTGTIGIVSRLVPNTAKTLYAQCIVVGVGFANSGDISETNRFELTNCSFGGSGTLRGICNSGETYVIGVGGFGCGVLKKCSVNGSELLITTFDPQETVTVYNFSTYAFGIAAVNYGATRVSNNTNGYYDLVHEINNCSMTGSGTIQSRFGRYVSGSTPNYTLFMSASGICTYS
jgi:hypothetical protein